MEVEQLLDRAREHATELAIARDMAEKSAIENEVLYDSEQTRRQAAESLARAARQLSSLETVSKVPEQILEQIKFILPFERGILFLEDVNGEPGVAAHHGLPKSAPLNELRYMVQKDGQDSDMYDAVARMKEPIQIGDVAKLQGWKQPDWLPKDHSWMGMPLFFNEKVMGMLVLTRSQAWAFNKDDAITANSFAVQASIAIENARLYDELNRFNQMMERMVSERVEELNKTYITLEKLDKNKSTFIQVAAHELRTPLTVIKGYLGMMSGHPAMQENESLTQAVEGVMRGTDRLHQIVNSMLDVARLENQILTPHLEALPIAPILRLLQKEFQNDFESRNIIFTLDEDLSNYPTLNVDAELLQKALNNVVINAIKFTPDNGAVSIHLESVSDEEMGPSTEIQIKDTGIGIDSSNLEIIFEKLFQLGDVALHSSGRATFKAGGPGLGLAITAGIIKAHGGRIWAESPGYDEKKLQGSTFYIRLPVPKK